MKNKEFVEELRIAYYKHKKAHGISLIDKAFQMAYDGNGNIVTSILKKLIPDLAAVETSGDPLVDQSKHIYITYKVTDGNITTSPTNGSIQRHDKVQSLECGQKMGKDDTRDK